MKKVKVRIPATVANLVCGFDILGMAINEPFDEMEVTLSDEPGIRIRHLDDFGLPEEPGKNVAGVALQSLLDVYGNQTGFNLVVHKHIKPGSGLGSSAAAAAGAVVAANMLLNGQFSNEQLIEFAMNGEELASGSRHADNIAPCIYGGITLVRSVSPMDITSIPSLPLFVTVIHPQIEVKTAEARKILPVMVPLKDAVRQWGNVAGLLTGLFKNDLPLIKRSLEDVLVEPVRSKLIFGFDTIKKNCMEAGALGGGISGSGPSIFMLSEHEHKARQLAAIMEDVYKSTGIDYKTYVTTISSKGVRLFAD